MCGSLLFRDSQQFCSFECALLYNTWDTLACSDLYADRTKKTIQDLDNVFRFQICIEDEPVWARELPDPSLRRAPSIHNPRNLKRRTAFFYIQTSWYMSLSMHSIIQSTVRFNCDTLYLVI